MISVPHRILPAHEKRAVEHAADWRQPGGIAVPYSGLDADRLNPGIAQSQGQRAIPVSDIKAEVGDPSNIQRGLGLIAPFEVPRLILCLVGVGCARQIEPTPTLIV